MKFTDGQSLRRVLLMFLLLFLCSYLLASNIERIRRFRLLQLITSGRFDFGPTQGKDIDSKGLHFPQNQGLVHRFSNTTIPNLQSVIFELEIESISLIHFRLIGTPTPIDFSLKPSILGDYPKGRHIVNITQHKETIVFNVDNRKIQEINSPDFRITGFEIEDMHSNFHLARIRYDPPIDAFNEDINFIHIISSRFARISLAAFAAIIFSITCLALPRRGSTPVENATFMLPLLCTTLFPLDTPLTTTLWVSSLASLVMIFALAVSLPSNLKRLVNIAVPFGAALLVALIWRIPSLGLSFALLSSALVLVLLELLFTEKPIRGFTFIFITVFALILVCLETTLRFSALAQSAKPMNVGAAFEEHDDLFYAPGNLFDDNVSFRVEKLRFRDRSSKLNAEPGVFRIISMGGSTTYGDGIEHNQYTWSGQLEKLLRDQYPTGSIEVLNGGVKGYNLFQIMLLFLHYVVEYNPDLLILYINTADSADTKGPFTYRELWRMKNEGRWSEVDELVKDEPLPKPSGWIADTQSVLHKVQLYNLLTRQVVKARGKALKPLAVRVGALKEVNPATDYRANLLEIIEMCKARDISLVLVNEYEVGANTNPDSKGSRVRKIMKIEAQNYGISYLGLNEEFQGRVEKDNLVFPHDPAHLSHQGHVEVAKRIARHLHGDGLLQ